MVLSPACLDPDAHRLLTEELSGWRVWTHSLSHSCTHTPPGLMPSLDV